MAMGQICRLAAVLACCAVGLDSTAAELDLHRPAMVLAGKHEILRLEKVRSAKVGNSALAEAKVLNPTEVLLKGLSKGDTTLTVGRVGEPDVVYALTVADRASTSESELLILGVGLQKTMPAEGVKRIAVGDPKIANVQIVSNKDLLLTGVAEGRTSLIVWFSDEVRVSYAVKVQTKALEETMKEIKQLLGAMDGIHLKVVGDYIYLDGEFESVEDANLVKKVCGLFQPTLRCL